jgi:hypothetical protein
MVYGDSEVYVGTAAPGSPPRGGLGSAIELEDSTMPSEESKLLAGRESPQRPP